MHFSTLISIAIASDVGVTALPNLSTRQTLDVVAYLDIWSTGGCDVGSNYCDHAKFIYNNTCTPLDPSCAESLKATSIQTGCTGK
jgi:hypothetical protein